MEWILYTLFMAMLLAAGVLIGLRIQNRRQQTRWHQQGYNSGTRRGWTNAAAQLTADAYTMREQRQPGITPEWLAGWEDASERLHRYWDTLDGENDHGVH